MKDFFNECVQITKAHAYDIVVEQVKELQAENEKLRQQIVGLKVSNEELQHHYDTTKGLWATDRPDLVSDPQNILFEI